MQETPRRIGRSVWAIFAGFLVVVILSIATDLLMHAIGVFPQIGQRASDKAFLLATIYRSVYAILGSYITARLAPYHPMLHALWGGVIGLVLGVIGAVTTWNRGPEFGPHWYPISLIVVALPCAWVGGRIAEKHLRARTADSVLTR